MTIGDKIKKIRTFRNMKQRDLGLALGFSESTADNRIAQYETNYRVPKKDTLMRIAEILNVNRYNFIENDSPSAEDIMFYFFWLEEPYGAGFTLFPLIRNPGAPSTSTDISARYDDNDEWPVKPPVAIHFAGLVDEFLHEWLIRKSELSAGTITRDEYFEWKLNWPSTCDGENPKYAKKWREQ